MKRLLVDAMCGTLATYLRMCGYDGDQHFWRGSHWADVRETLAEVAVGG